MSLRNHIEVRGVVQGIGFRPLVYRLATELSLTGFVLNNSGGVAIEIQGQEGNLDEFLSRLQSELPAGGVVHEIVANAIALVEPEAAFSIHKSETTDRSSSSLAPDRYVCDKCLDEMRDPKNRRYKYPFINCTNCGPRLTITKRLPYDRPWTTMAEFDMCESCRREYEDPMDRRYHAQPVACPKCGPHLKLVYKSWSETVEGDADSIFRAASHLRSGGILAVKGIGGFHLAADASNAEAVRRLRTVKRRPRKPLALMVKDIETAGGLVALDSDAKELMLSPAAPIVVARAKDKNGLAPGIAPGLEDLGVMLPYAPLHHLLFDECPAVLVMTSGNPSSEPIIKDDEDALERLDADALLIHDREIEVSADDSVVRLHRDGPVFLRRSRGYVPETLDVRFLPEASVLALGAELKVTVSALHRGELMVGRHLGDMTNARTCEALEDEVSRMLEFSRLEPAAAAVDLHPDFFAAQFCAEKFPHLQVVRVQHHHAHLAAVMLEHGVGPEDKVAAIVMDGAGFGEDDTIWGGEVLVGGYAQFERVGRLRPIPMPGGDKAAREPRRMATSMLWDAGGSFQMSCYDEQIAAIAPMRAFSPLTSSAGRLFDGAAAILGVAPARQDYEGEAAMLLETVANPDCDDAYAVPIEGGVADTRALTVSLCEDKDDVSVRAARFINGLADAMAALALETGHSRIALGGGSMVNRLLVGRLRRELARGGAKVLTAKRLPPGDGGISAGQAACVACRLAQKRFQEPKE